MRSALNAADVEVITGEQAADEAAEATGTALKFVNMFLMTFAIVALVVGSFVIYNTFSITVAQRTKETALLRAIGAKRRQVMRSIRFEALAIGVFASAVGAAAGVGLAQVLRSVLSAFGLDLPSGSAIVEPRTIVVSMVTGIVVTLVAAWLPAACVEGCAHRGAACDRGGEFSSLVASHRLRVGCRPCRRRIHRPRSVGCRRRSRRPRCAGRVPRCRHARSGDCSPLHLRVIGWPLPHLRGVSGTLARGTRCGTRDARRPPLRH